VRNLLRVLIVLVLTLGGAFSGVLLLALGDVTMVSDGDVFLMLLLGSVYGLALGLLAARLIRKRPSEGA
jgi:hypothetical protein